MIRTILFVPFTICSTLFFSLVAVVGGLVGAPKGLYDWVHRNWARGMLRAAGVRLSVSGLEHVPEGAARIFVSNHQSMFDIWALMATMPSSLRFVTKQELSRIPIFARACRSAGHVFIDRNDRAAAIQAIREAGKRMRAEGLSLVFFPEGTRSPDGRLGRFKKGSFVLAIETGVPLVPVAVDGGHRVLPKGRRTLRQGRVTVRCAPVIPLAGLGAEDRDALLKRTREAIASMLEEMRRDRALLD
ncbi:MAG: lysophospholipid acyltransferase family protein [Gemmatimonadota bacterium]